MHSSKYNQQDATLYNILYYCQYSTCFRRFLRPSSGAKNCTHRIGYISSLLAVTASVGESERLVVHGILQLTRRACSFTWIFSTELQQITTLSITYSHRSHLLRSSPMQNSWIGIWNSKRSGIFIEKEFLSGDGGNLKIRTRLHGLLLTPLYPVLPITRSIFKFSPNLWLLPPRSIFLSVFPVI